MNKHDKRHQSNLLSYERQVDEIYATAVKEAARLGVSLHGFDQSKLFSFSDYPSTKKRIDKLLEELRENLTIVIVNGVRSEWTLANDKNDELCQQVFGDNIGKLTQQQYRRYYNNNDKAREAFIKRKESGLNISDRVWNYTSQFKTEIELGLDIGIRNGLSATKIAKELKTYLRYPDKLFRRVKDEHGNLQLSRTAKASIRGKGFIVVHTRMHGGWRLQRLTLLTAPLTTCAGNSLTSWLAYV